MNNHTIRFALVGILGCAAMSSQAFTMATFADPAIDGSTPLFNITASSISGGWNGNGLTLQTPGWAGPDIANAKFTMPSVSIAPIGPGAWNTGSGQIDFTDATNNLVFRINFQTGFLSLNGVGGSDLFGHNVTFSGPGVPVVSNETFNFSFANFIQTPTGYTTTASMTSSAVPEPASIAAIGIGVVGLLRRRRRA